MGNPGGVGSERMRGARRTRNVCRCARAAGPGVPEPRAAPLPPLAMAPPPACRSPMSPPPPLLLLLLSLALLGARARAEPAGSAVPAQSRPCVDCHAFEFMQRALQDLRKTACSLDARTETLLLQAERRALCACWPAGR
ncbi:PREDICTED: LOW QUALITY PROTEIN: neuropeptide-like protein C4orf48 homolog [Cercocebus atys]|uniref:LOW QUALITY PROTEIN: neuropeptide-like protein C4orf48 homolog n=2 Tax=Cercopithecinae TaxID=9528 RepID=UPI0003ABC3CC|nr:PREDICTED: LOW QUALITY PROTEIN: neuropeptide-like protein C4orf48 homolog [Cercocebus atys]